MSFRQGTHLSAHKKIHQKLNYWIDLKVIMEKIAENQKVEENFTVFSDVMLPVIRNVQEIPVLPSLFL